MSRVIGSPRYSRDKMWNMFQYLGTQFRSTWEGEGKLAKSGTQSWDEWTVQSLLCWSLLFPAREIVWCRLSIYVTMLIDMHIRYQIKDGAITSKFPPCIRAGSTHTHTIKAYEQFGRHFRQCFYQKPRIVEALFACETGLNNSGIDHGYWIQNSSFRLTFWLLIWTLTSPLCPFHVN